jgi:hypothetical protein
MIPPTPFLHAFIVRRPNPSGPVFSYSCVFALSTPLSCVEFPPSYSSSTSSPLPLTHFQSLLSAPSSPPPLRGCFGTYLQTGLSKLFRLSSLFSHLARFRSRLRFSRAREREREGVRCVSVYHNHAAYRNWSRQSPDQFDLRRPRERRPIDAKLQGASSFSSTVEPHRWTCTERSSATL